jgi:hypothetical protein
MLSLLLALQVAAPPAAVSARDSVFAALVAELSEPGGFFFSDNLVSNETSYLHVVGKLEELGLRGGAYLGVGPEQNFSYIAAVQPAVALIIDIRRDNLLLHLTFKAAFELARNRLEYLCLVYGRPCPPDLNRWTDRPLEDLLEFIDGVPLDTTLVQAQDGRLFDRIVGLGIPLSPEDLATIARFHREFVQHGLDLRFSSFGRRSWSTFPTTRQLYRERDLAGRQVSYVATEARFRVVRRLQTANKIIPVVGNLAGPTAVPAIGRYLARNGQRLTALYTSNVEHYLFRDGTFSQFAAHVASLPQAPAGVLIRSYFDRQTGLPHPLGVPGHTSVQLLESLAHFVEATREMSGLDYWGLVTNGAIPLQPARAPLPSRGKLTPAPSTGPGQWPVR